MSDEQDTIFGKIIRGEVSADTVYEDDKVLAFRDVDPQAPCHILIIPKKPLKNLSYATSDDRELLGELLLRAAQIAKDEGLEEGGYRTVINTGKDGGQTVFHLHVHLLGGRSLDWPPG